MKRFFACSAAAAMAGSVVLIATAGATSAYSIAVDDAQVDARGYYGTVSATVTDGDGNGVAGIPLVFQKFRDGEGRAEICRASTGPDGVATCTDDPYPVGYGPRTLEIDPTVADQQTLVYVDGDYATYALGDAHFRAEPYCEPLC